MTTLALLRLWVDYSIAEL